MSNKAFVLSDKRPHVVQVCIVDVDCAADAQALRDQGFEACFMGLAPESSQAMLDNIQTALHQKPLPGYEPEDAAHLLLQVMPTFKLGR